MTQLKVHNAPWSDCPSKNVFSDRLNREYDNSAFSMSDGKTPLNKIPIMHQI